MGENGSSRIQSIDVMKGIVIICIVLVHIIIKRSDGVGNGDSPLYMQLLYLALMSFFFISGYFYRPERSFRENMKKRVMQLAVALVICSFALPAIVYVWLAIWGQAPADGLTDYITAVLRSLNLTNIFEDSSGPCPCPVTGSCIGYYYLWTMLFSFVVFYALAERVRKNLHVFVITVAVLLIIAALLTYPFHYRLPFGIQLCPIAIAFMFVGTYLQKWGIVDRINSFQIRDPKYWALILGSLVVLLALAIPFSPGTQYDQMIYGDFDGLSVFPYFFESIAMFLFALFVCLLISKIPHLSNFLTMTGNHSLGLLLLHGFIATLIMIPFYTIPTDQWFPPMPMVPRVVIAIATLAISLVICIYGPKILAKLMKKDSQPADDE